MMKRYLYIILAAILAFSACQMVELAPQADNAVVDLCFNISVPQAGGTKALADAADLRTLHVAIFDGNGYKVGFEKAEIVGQPDYRTYTYSIRVTSTDEPRVFHFLGNCPEDIAEKLQAAYGNEMTLIGGIVCDDEAYWQRIELARGIPADVDAARTAIGSVELVRNFSKLYIDDNSSNFDLAGLFLYNVPDKAFMAPYINSGSSAGQFVEDYSGKQFDQVSRIYPGYRPAEADLIEGTRYKIVPRAGGLPGSVCAYMFESPIPTDPAKMPFVVIYGIHKDSPDTCYYRVNLRDADGRHYPILRNFDFHVSLINIVTPGESTLEDAIVSAGSGDISTNTSFISSTNISDSESQLFVDKTSVTVVKRSTITVRYKYYPDIQNDAQTIDNRVRESASDNLPIEISLGAEGEYGPAIESYSVSDADVDGFRTITIETTSQDAHFKEQTLTITGHGKGIDGTYDGGTVSRTITVVVRPTFKLTVDCPKVVNNVAGSALPVTVGLESDIPSSVFPVNVSVEAVALTLAPAAGENLPVTTGKSLSLSGKPAYQFVKAVTYEEYLAARESMFVKDNVSYYPIVCNFVTNTANSASVIYADSELFNDDNCEFVLAKHFTDLSFTEALVGNAQTTSLSFTAESASPVVIKLVGALKDGSNEIHMTTVAGVNTISGLKTTSFGKAVQATISNEWYLPADITRYRSVEFKANTIETEVLPIQPCAFSGTNLTADFNVTAGANAVQFGANRQLVDTFTLPAITYSGNIVTARKNNNLVIYSFYSYSFTIDVANYDSTYEYSYSTDGNSFTPITPTQGTQFNISNVRSQTVYFRAAKNGVSTTLTLAYNNSKPTNDTGSQSVNIYGNYVAAGPNSTTTITFTEDVTENSVVPLSYTYDNKTATCNTLTVNDIATGTAGQASTITFIQN